MASVSSANPLRPDDAALKAAHDALLADRSLQFRMEAFVPPKPPAWLEALAKMIGALGPLLQWVFWIGLALIVAAIAWLIAREVGRLGLGLKVDRRLNLSEEAWRPTAGEAMALLSDADALAAQGRFAEAVHLILLRSIDDLRTRRPNTVRPAQTTRDIGGLGALPESARPAFGRIAQVVETSLFGGAAVDQPTFAECRDAYEAFAFPKVWAA